MGSHLKDITGDSPRSFVKKDEKHFEKSISPGAFCTIIETHFENKFYIPEWMLDPKLGFAFWRKSTNTLANGIEYGPYNVFKMLNGENPESNSGTMEHHHVYQTHSVVTPICWSEHKGKTTQYHKSKEKTKIDRSICGTEFHYINKMIAFLQMARMCRSVLEDTCAELSHETEALMKLISKYSGNIDVIPNESRSSVGRSLFTELAEAGDVISENSNGASSSEKDDKGTSPLIESRKRRRASSSSIKDLGEDENVNLAHELFPQVNRSTSLNPHRRKPLSLASINSSSVASFS